jgi:iron complex transport system ATP-binding protein
MGTDGVGAGQLSGMVRAVMALLELDAVSASYDGQRVLSAVSLAVSSGEFVGLLGPNGAGKSTLLRVACGMHAPDEGRVLLDGAPLASLDRRAVARRVAFVPQRTDLAFPFSVLAVVLMGRAPHLGGYGLEGPEDRAIAEEALREVDAFGLRERPFSALSGGERQRVVLARALCQRAQVLLLDEPAAFLDIRHQVELHELLRSGTRAGRFAVVSAMHDLNLASQACDRVLLLSEGHTAGLGTIDDVLTYARVRETFGVDVYVGVNELTGARYFLPMAGRS